MSKSFIVIDNYDEPTATVVGAYDQEHKHLADQWLKIDDSRYIINEIELNATDIVSAMYIVVFIKVNEDISKLSVSCEKKEVLIRKVDMITLDSLSKRLSKDKAYYFGRPEFPLGHGFTVSFADVCEAEEIMMAMCQDFIDNE